MAPSESFWRLVEQSQLLSKNRCDELARAYAADRQASGPHASNQPDTAEQIADWLCARNAITAYHRTVLLAGRPGPFVYGPYRVDNKLAGPGRKNWFAGRHLASSHGVLLMFAAGALLKDPALWQTVSSRARRIAPLCRSGREAHLAELLDAVDLQAYKFLVYGEMAGATLAEQLRPGERMSVAEACRAAHQIALALAALHDAGIVHGEPSPASIWREPNGSCKLLVASQETTSAFVDPVDYLAPEAARPDASPDALGDVYALGCTLYQLLTGQPPFAGGDRESKLKRHATERISPLEPFGASASLAKLVAFMMAKKASLRTASARAVAEQLAPFAAASRAAPNVSPLQSPRAPTWPTYDAWRQQNAFATLNRAAAPPAIAAIPAIGPARAAPIQAAASIQTPTPVQAPAPVIVAPIEAATIRPHVKPGPVIVAASEKSPSKRKRRQTTVLAAAGLATIVVSVVLVVSLSGKSGQEENVDRTDGTVAEASLADSKSTSTPSASSKTSEPNGKNRTGNQPSNRPGGAVFEQAVVADDGRRLWASPTAGVAVERGHLPPDAQVFLFLRPAALLADEEGGRALAALGPGLAAARADWEAAAGVTWEELASLTITLHANGENPPRVCTVATLAAEHTPLLWTEKWGNPASVKIEEPAAGGASEYFQRGPWCYFAPPEAEGRTIVVGAKEEVEAVATRQPAPARREVEQLLRYADRERHFTAVFAPNFFFGDGRKLFAGEYGKILGPLSWFLGDGLQAGLVSLHLGEELYLEMRFVAELGLDEYKLSSQLQSRLAEMPERIDDYVAAVDPPPYWRKVAFRYPRMIHLLNQQTRIGAESDQAVLNAVLPKVAAHNLLAASEVVLATAPGTAVGTALTGAATGAAAPVPQTIEDALQAKISLAFPAQSLEFAMQEVATALKETHPTLPFEFHVKINGGDLEKDGITRNQTVRDVNERDKTVGEVLTAMVMKANPITTVKAPNEADQKLVWVIADDPENAGRKAVLITTRDAAATKGYALPGVFK